jgi:hypothetical protein
MSIQLIPIGQSGVGSEFALLNKFVRFSIIDNSHHAPEPIFIFSNLPKLYFPNEV